MPVFDIDGVEVSITGDVTREEAAEYVKRGREKRNGRLERIEGFVDGEEIELKYFFEPEKFERIRRVTGYLVGTIDRWNDAKRAELEDRVKHAHVGGAS